MGGGGGGGLKNPTVELGPARLGPADHGDIGLGHAGTGASGRRAGVFVSNFGTYANARSGGGGPNKIF